MATLSEPVKALPESGETKATDKTYGRILRSSLLVGGSSAIGLLVGVVRAKTMAVLLGPAGVGLAGLYTSILDLAQNIAGLGVNSSGVRQIAQAAGTEDIVRIALTAAVLRRVSLLLGLLGTVLVAVFSPQISVVTFGGRQHWPAIVLLSVAVFFRLIAAGQGALIQGMRRIGDLARMSVAGASLGAGTSILLVYFFREQGIVPSLVVAAAALALVSWWYSRKITIPKVPRDARVMVRERTALLKLGFAFLGSSLITAGTSYVVRILVLRKSGIEATGLYQSAWTLGGMYVAFVLQAMGADFYPRLCATAHDNEVSNRLVNEQTHVGLLLAGPGILATLALAPEVISLFYSARFTGAVDILRWICLGTMLQVVNWPMGFVIIAKSHQNLFLLSDLAWAVVYLSLTAWLVAWFGPRGAGMAFFGSYVFHGLLTYPIVRHLSAFRWSRDNLKTGLLLFGSIVLLYLGFALLPLTGAVVFGAVVAVATGFYSLRTLLTLSSPDRIPAPFLRLLSFKF